jgi:hypothetical protein
MEEKGTTDMKKMLGTTVALAVLAIFISSAQAVIEIETATVQGGVAFIQGNGAVKGAAITWEGFSVTKANKTNGGFSFFGILPDDCTGELKDTAETIQVAVLLCTRAAAAPVPKTGQTVLSLAGDDGDLEKGVASPNPRFTDNGNGTITDNLTALIWLKNANCFGAPQWATAISDANSLAAGACGLSDGSVAGDWRLPNVRELHSLVDYGVNTCCDFTDPVLPTGHPFTNFQASFYWSSTTTAGGSSGAWLVFFGSGFVFDDGKFGNGFVIAVRGGS